MMNVRIHEKLQLPWIVFGLMLLLLPTLAYVQYGWLGQMSEWEQQRMRTNLDASLERFSEEFDREIARYFTIFSLRVSPDSDMESAVRRAYEQFAEIESESRIVDALYVVTETEEGSREYREFIRDELREIHAADNLKPVLDSGPSYQSEPGNLTTARVSSAPLALVVPMIRIHLREEGNVTKVLERKTQEAVVVIFNEEALVESLLSPLARKYFWDNESSEYLLRVSDVSSGRDIYVSSPESGRFDTPDATSNIFSLRLGDFFFVRLDQNNEATADIPNEDHSLATYTWEGVLSRDVTHIDEKSIDLVIERTNGGIWLVEAAHVAGSLESAVAANRWRNVFLSAGILVVLAAGMGMLAVATTRARTMASQRLEFVAGVTHELRTPLAVIRSAGQNLADDIVTDSEGVKRYGETIEREAERLTGLVENVLLFSRISAAQNLNINDVNIDSIIDNVLLSLQEDLGNLGCVVERESQISSARVQGDVIAIESILRNLIRNAAQYGGENTVKISIDNADLAGEKAIGISIIDNGPGIDFQEQQTIFEPFVRGVAAQKGSTSAVPGTGIGLTVAQRLAKAMGGEISLQSVPQEGAIFTLILPVAGGQNG